MLKIVTEIICSSLLTILMAYMLKKIINSDTKISNIKSVILLSILVLISIASYTSEYSIEPVIIRFMANIIIFKIIFDESIFRITILYILAMIIILISDIINASIMMNFYTLTEIRTIPNIMIISHIFIGLYTYIIINTKFIINKLKIISKNLNDNNIITAIILCISIFLLIICTLYNIGDIFAFNIQYLINVLTITVFIIVLIIFFIDSNKYQELQNEYNSLFKYTQTFEDSIDKISLSSHEFKNELAVLREYIKDNKKSKSLEIIDGIIIEERKYDSTILNSIKNIPKGGIKGLIYYKIMVATNKKLKISLDISKTIKGKLPDFDIEEAKLICNLLGIYLDNAIDASVESNKKLIGIELYNMNNQICFVISNTFKNKEIDLEKVNKNGYTTKGKGHGRGLYLAKKLITKTEWLKSDTRIFNNMYIQKLIISKELINENKKIILRKTKK